MNHGSLFSGIGGFDLAAQWMGWHNVFHCEKEKFCQRILKHYWPNATLYDDITEADFTGYKNKIDILSGGFPCQPFSTAGKQQGTEDSRYLWPEMLRAIGEIKPRWIVGENVRGLVSWSEGLVFEQVCTDLEAEGYEVFPVILPACGVNAPHRRERIWFIAHTVSEGTGTSTARVNEPRQLLPQTGRVETKQFNKSFGESEFITDTAASGVERDRTAGQQKPRTQIEPGLSGRNDARTDWAKWPTQYPLCSRNDGLSARLDGITFSKWRNESIKGYGNAIVPQVALQIFKAIAAYETQAKS